MRAAALTSTPNSLSTDKADRRIANPSTNPQRVGSLLRNRVWATVRSGTTLISWAMTTMPLRSASATLLGR